MAVVTVHENVTGVPVRRGDGLLVVAGGQLVRADRAADAGNDKAESIAVRLPPPPRNRGSYCQAAVRGHHPVHGTSMTLARAVATVGRARRPPAEPARPPARPPGVVCVRAAVLCSRVRGRDAGVRSNGVGACTDATTAVSLRGSCSPQVRPRRAAARSTRRAALLAAGRLCDAAPPGLNRGTGLGPGAEGAEQRRNGGGRCARGSLGDRTQVGVEYRARIWHRQSAAFCGL